MSQCETCDCECDTLICEGGIAVCDECQEEATRSYYESLIDEPVIDDEPLPVVDHNSNTPPW